jgi:DNA-binding CsgD family transcriptional regulator
MSLEHPGGDTRTPSAKQAIARREEQIVALKLRHHSYSAIARVVGISRQSAQKAFLRALHRNTAADIQTHHRSELAELDAQQAKLWTVVDNPKVSEKNLIAAINAMNRIHIRRAHLLGLDAPTKLDVSGIYQRGGADVEAEQFARDAVLEALPIEEQRRIYDIFYQARLRAAARDLSQPAIETTLSNGSDHRNDVADSDAEPEE